MATYRYIIHTRMGGVEYTHQALEIIGPDNPERGAEEIRKLMQPHMGQLAESGHEIIRGEVKVKNGKEYVTIDIPVHYEKGA